MEHTAPPVDLDREEYQRTERSMADLAGGDEALFVGDIVAEMQGASAGLVRRRGHERL